MHENDEAIEAWNTVLFDKFQRFRPLLDVGLGRHGTHALELISPTEGMHAVDLGCGFGETSFDIARRVGPTGSCVGVDAASRFVDSAAVEAKAIAAENVRFECHDVANDSLGGPYDYAFSRFGMMFFASPVAALRNVRASLKPGATFVSVVWRKKVDNDFLHAAEVEVEDLSRRPPKRTK
ncbi:MAG: class I SAM-dependent methyltransferase [Polyangiales bacterium]